MREHYLTLNDPGGSDGLHEAACLILFFLAVALEKFSERNDLYSTTLSLVRVGRARSPRPNIRFAFRVIFDSFRDGTVSSLRRR